MIFQNKLTDPQRFVWLYGTTPPRAEASDDQIAEAAGRLAERVRSLRLDAVLVYDVQNEAGRTPFPRPFPFIPTVDPRSYAHKLRMLTGLPTIAYKCIAEMTERSWSWWLDETYTRYHGTAISLVGRSTTVERQPALSLTQAIRMAAEHDAHFTLGGVVIPERHSALRSECARVIHKSQAGCRYFVSQAVYEAQASIRFLTDYAHECRERDLPPRRIVLTFVPCGRRKTMEFIKWLGVSISADTQQAILDDPAPLSRSIRLCCANLQAILEHAYALEIPLGVNVESVSITRAEIDASIELVHALRDVVNSTLS